MRTRYVLTVNDIVEMSGVTQVTVNNWVKRQWIKPSRDVVHNGPGGGRCFNAIEATAMVYAGHWMRLGCAGEVIPLSIKRISKMTFNQLTQRLEDGQTYFVPIPPECRKALDVKGDVWFSPRLVEADSTANALFEAINLQTAFHTVLKRVAEKFPELVEDQEEPVSVNGHSDDSVLNMLGVANRIAKYRVTQRRTRR